MPMESKPGPRLALVAGTRTVTCLAMVERPLRNVSGQNSIGMIAHRSKWCPTGDLDRWVPADRLVVLLGGSRCAILIIASQGEPDPSSALVSRRAVYAGRLVQAASKGSVTQVAQSQSCSVPSRGGDSPIQGGRSPTASSCAISVLSVVVPAHGDGRRCYDGSLPSDPSYLVILRLRDERIFVGRGD